jgi:hypothetical protein
MASAYTAAMERYDNGTRVWSTVLGITVAAAIDWGLVVNPARGDVVHPPHTGWWYVALVAVSLPPAAWVVGKLVSRRWLPALAWFAVLAAVVTLHYLPLNWAEGRQ